MVDNVRNHNRLGGWRFNYQRKRRGKDESYEALRAGNSYGRCGVQPVVTDTAFGFGMSLSF